MEHSVVLFTGDAIGVTQDGAGAASGYRVAVNRTTFVGAGQKQGHTGSSEGLARDTELGSLLGKGVVLAGGSQTFFIRIGELIKNTDSWVPLPVEI